MNDYTGLLPKLIEISKIGKAHNWDITVLPGENEKCYFNSEIIGKLHFLGLNVLVQCQWLETDLDIGDCLAACLKSDRPDGLLPIVVVNVNKLIYFLILHIFFTPSCKINIFSSLTVSTCLKNARS